MRGPRTGIAGLMLAMLFASASIAAAQLPEVPADAFEPSSNCSCHAALVTQWARSMHAQALTDPLYLAKLEQADRETGGAVVPFCEECHGAVAAMAGEVEDRVFSEQGGEGVTCDLCHQMTGRQEGRIGNTSIVVTPDGVKRGPHDDAVSRSHESEYSAFHETAEFCGTCHNVFHPVNGLVLEATYTEWLEGPYSGEGIVCQDCHMTPGPGVTKPNPGRAAAGGPDRPHIYTMTFVGGNVALGDPVLAEERLQAAAEIDLEAPDVVESGGAVAATVRITNVGAGHYLPTGLTDFRRMWVELVATGPDGSETLVDKREFHTVFADADGNAPVEIWDAVAVDSDDRIPPRESVENTWEAVMPEDGPLALTATLYYRSCTEEFAEKAGVDVPTTTMTSASTLVYTSEAEAEAARRQAPGASPAAGGGLLLVMTAAAMALIAAILAYFILRHRASSS